MILPNFYEVPLFKDLRTQMGLDSMPVETQLSITIAPVQMPLIERHPTIPIPIKLLTQVSEAPRSLPKTIYERLSHIFSPKKTSIQIDQAKKDLITEQTKRVAGMIADVITEQLEEDKDVQRGPQIGELSVLSELQKFFPKSIEKLDSSYHSVLKDLIKKEIWKKDEFDTLIRSHMLMPAGTIDILNEWADEYLSDFILDTDSEPYRLNLSLLNN